MQKILIATDMSVLHNLIVQQYFSELHPAKILDLSTKSFSPCEN